MTDSVIAGGLASVDPPLDRVLPLQNCNAEYHTYCLNPPLSDVPKGKWYCDSCKAKGFDSSDGKGRGGGRSRGGHDAGAVGAGKAAGVTGASRAGKSPTPKNAAATVGSATRASPRTPAAAAGAAAGGSDATDGSSPSGKAASCGGKGSTPRSVAGAGNDSRESTQDDDAASDVGSKRDTTPPSPVVTRASGGSGSGTSKSEVSHHGGAHPGPLKVPASGTAGTGPGVQPRLSRQTKAPSWLDGTDAAQSVRPRMGRPPLVGGRSGRTGSTESSSTRSRMGRPPLSGRGGGRGSRSRNSGSSASGTTSGNGDQPVKTTRMGRPPLSGGQGGRAGSQRGNSRSGTRGKAGAGKGANNAESRQATSVPELTDGRRKRKKIEIEKSTADNEPAVDVSSTPHVAGSIDPNETSTEPLTVREVARQATPAVPNPAILPESDSSSVATALSEPAAPSMDAASGSSQVVPLTAATALSSLPSSAGDENSSTVGANSHTSAVVSNVGVSPSTGADSLSAVDSTLSDTSPLAIPRLRGRAGHKRSSSEHEQAVGDPSATGSDVGITDSACLTVNPGDASPRYVAVAYPDEPGAEAQEQEQTDTEPDSQVSTRRLLKKKAPPGDIQDNTRTKRRRESAPGALNVEVGGRTVRSSTQDGGSDATESSDTELANGGRGRSSRGGRPPTQRASAVAAAAAAASTANEYSRPRSYHRPPPRAPAADENLSKSAGAGIMASPRVRRSKRKVRGPLSFRRLDDVSMRHSEIERR